MKEELKAAWRAFWESYYIRHPKVVGKCKYCGNPIFDQKTKWREKGECVFCYNAYQIGKRGDE